MDANSLILALAGQPGFLPVREDQAGATRDITGVDRRVDDEGNEYLVLLSTPRNKPEKAPETGPSPLPSNMPYYPPGVR